MKPGALVRHVGGALGPVDDRHYERFEFAADAVIEAKQSEHTRKAYRADLAGWLDYCRACTIDPLAPTLHDATTYRNALIGSEDTRRRRLATLSSIYRTLFRAVDGQRPLVSGNPFHPEILAWPPAGKVLKSRRITGEQAEQIIDAAAAQPRDQALLCLLYDTGWRRAQIATLPRANIRDGRAYGRGKGGKEHEVELPPRSIAAIVRWLGEAPPSLYLFPASTVEDLPLHPNTVNKIVDHWATVIAPEAHPHSFRALFIRDGHEAGLPSYEIQGAAGHASSDMTARYDGKTRGTGVARKISAFRAQRKKAPT